jgi:hypothetical protein
MPSFIIGGCAYRSMVHTAHASSVAGFADYCARSLSTVMHGIVYQHTSNLPQGRCLWLRDRINPLRSEPIADYAVSVDSDTAFSAEPLALSLTRVCGDIAIGIAPVIRDSGRGISLNIFHGPGEPLAVSACGAGYPELWAGGFGLVVFNLKWFRHNWRFPYPEQFGTELDYLNQGEDIQFCRSVVKRGGKIIPLWVPTAHYDSSGNRVIGGKLDYENGRMICDR